MAIITFGDDDDVVSVLLEKTDIVRIKEGNTTYSQSAKNRNVGEMLINSKVKLCVIRGERD